MIKQAKKYRVPICDGVTIEVAEDQCTHDSSGVTHYRLSDGTYGVVKTEFLRSIDRQAAECQS